MTDKQYPEEESVEQIIKNDMNMNLIGALILLIFAASFNAANVKFDFNLAKADVATDKKTMSAPKTETLMIFRKEGHLILKFRDNIWPFDKAKQCLDNINPSVPVIIASEKGCDFTFDQLTKIFGVLKNKGVSNVSIVAEGKR